MEVSTDLLHGQNIPLKKLCAQDVSSSFIMLPAKYSLGFGAVKKRISAAKITLNWNIWVVLLCKA